MSAKWLTKTAIEALNAKAAKLNRKGGNLTVTVGESHVIYASDEDKRMDRGGVQVFEVEVSGNLHFAGWTIIAGIDHTIGGNIIRSYEDAIPEQYRTADSYCDHCKTQRHRNATTIIRNDTTGEYKQIGKNCLAGYLGVDLEGYAAYLSFLTFYEGTAEEDERERFGGRGTPCIDTFHALCKIAECIRCFGYVSRKMASESARPIETTVNRMNRYDHPFSGAAEKANREEQEAAGYKVDYENPPEIVTKALEWIKTVDDAGSDFLHNLKVLTAGEYIEARHLPYLAALPTAYLRAMEQIKEREKKAANPSKHVGTVGQRITTKVTSKWIASYETDFGITRVYEMTDEAGNILIWKTGTTIRDGEMTIKATIKEHSEYKGRKQTIISRVAEIEAK